MKYDKIMFMLVLAIFIFGAASVCASDVSGTVIASEDTGQMELSAGNENEIVERASNEEVIGEGNVGTFQELQENITQGYASGHITLDKDYEYEDEFSTDGITITQGITIDGQGHKIDAKGKARIFNIETDNVILKNITFLNGKSTDGGAINWKANYGSVLDCRFENNTATGNGGAVYFWNSGDVTNCNFTNNTAEYGGAIRFYGTGTAINCNFINNTASIRGGALLFADLQSYSKATICTFINNSALNSGAIGSANRYLVIADTCIFKTNSDTRSTVIRSPTLNVNNFTTVYGSGEKLTFDLKTNSSIPVTNGNISISVYFKGNGEWVRNYTCLSGEGWIPDLPVGSYIAFFDTEYAGFQKINRTITITAPEHTFWFLNYTINGNDNPVIELSHDFYFDPAYDAAFVNGIVINRPVTIKGNGNAIDAKRQARIFYVQSANAVLENLTIKNANYNGNGGAIYFDRTGTVTNCNFTNNSATKNGGAIRMYSGSVENCNFTDNHANYGGAVFSSTGNVTNCNFTNNSASGDDGGAINMGSGTVSNCNFTGNTARLGGAIWMNSGTVTNCNFTNNSATQTGGAVWMYSGSVENCNFTGNTARLGGAVYFEENAYGRIINCTFTGNTANYGGAAYFDMGTTGRIINCTFTDNSASFEGGAVWMYSGTVSNCNFTGNAADYGGAIRFRITGTVSNCNFTGNAADYGGAIRIVAEGSVSNCNFTGNAADYGGAVYFYSTGDVTNCNFTDNNASEGSAIYFFATSASKSVSNSRFLNNRANAEALKVTINDNNITITFTGQNNLLNAIYSRNDAEVTFTNVTYWGSNGINNTGSSATIPSRSNKAAGQNITVGVVVNDKLVSDNVYVTDENGAIVLNIAAGDNYYITARHDTDSYYTEAEKTISNNTKFNVNVTSQTTNNKTINITAKSNIFNEVMPGKLLFILPNGTQINATYGTNGTWWAVHTFDAYGEYKVNASYVGLDNVTVNDGTITINKVNSTIILDNIVLDYGETKNVTVTTTGSTGITAKIDGNNVTVINNYTIQIPVLDAGTYNLTVTTIPDDDYNPVTKEVNITVNKVNSTLTVSDIIFDYGSSGSTVVSLTGADGVNATVVGQPKTVVKVNGTNITVSDLDAGTYTLTVTAIADKNHNNITKNATITVNKVNGTLTVNDVVLDYGESKNITVTTEGATGITAKIDGVNVTVSNYTIPISGLSAGNYTLTVTTIADKNHNPVTKEANINVNKVESTLTVDDIVFDYGSEGSGDVSFTGASEVTANVVNQPSAVVSVSGNKISVSGLGAGTYTLNVTTVPDENHTSVTETATLSVNKVNSSLTLDDVVLDYGESKNITVTTEGATDITAKIDGVNVTVNGYTIPISGLGAGNHTLSVTTIADKNHNPVTKEVNITVNKLSTEIILANETLDLKVGDEVPVLVNLTPAGAGNLTFTSSDEDLVFVEDNVTIVANSQGQAIITVSFAGNENYTAAENKTITVNVALNDASVSVENDTMDLKVDETSAINATIEPDTIMLKIKYTSSDDSVATVDKNGIVTAVGEGRAIITLEVGDDEIYAKISTTVTVTVKKIDTSIDVDSSSLELEIGDNSSIVATLTPADAGNVTFTSSNSSVVTVDAKGNVKAVGAGEANITVSFAGDDKYAAAENKTVEVTVADYMVVSAPDLTKYYNGPERFVVAVTDSKGNPLANQSVNITINGVTYSRTTNDNGTASMAIRLVGGQYNVTTIVDNITVYSTVTVLPTVNATDLVKVFRNGTQFYATFKDSNGDYLPEGTLVRFNIHGEFYDRQVSGDKGLVKLNINIQQGQYVITSMNLVTGENASNNITVI
ncbi:MAG: Ig-like domain-containing protein, partial [Methanobrevibacter sp.]|uniref:beta strand repeat-containing protein n=1 Tax=Methanobrevibacter sp. TaxID=66852 RepID=UPI001B0996FC